LISLAQNLLFDFFDQLPSEAAAKSSILFAATTTINRTALKLEF